MEIPPSVLGLLISFKMQTNALELKLNLRIEAVVIFGCCNSIISVAVGKILRIAYRPLQASGNGKG
jgi:hypothetical protein